MTTQTDYEALVRAINSGHRQVRFGDRTVEYRSLEEMMRVRDLMARELGLVRRKNRVFTSFSKGLAQ
ncbi:MAG: phage head-tail joining protein [Wenzhouxiangella sp.]